MGFQVGHSAPGMSSPLRWLVSYDRKLDGDLTEHRPTLFNQRLGDIYEKLYCIHLACTQFVKIAKEIDSKYDADKNQLKMGDEIWWLTLYVNYIVFESRAILDLFAAITKVLYPHPKLPDSFKDLLKEKHLKSIKDNGWKNHLIKTWDSEWIKSVVTKDYLSVRDLNAHFAQTKLIPSPGKNKDIDWNLCISRKVGFPFNNIKRQDLSDFITIIVKGLEDLILL